MFDDALITVEDFIEYGDEYGRVGRVILSVENFTVAPIYSAAISLRLETNIRFYYTTVYDERGIPPHMKVFIAVEFAYISPEERSSVSGVAVTDSYFM